MSAHGSMPTPPDRRPYRRASEEGHEQTVYTIDSTGQYVGSGELAVRQGPMPLYIADKDGQPILTIHPDGRVTLDQPEKADEAAHTFADYVISILRPQFTSEGAQQCS